LHAFRITEADICSVPQEHLDSTAMTMVSSKVKACPPIVRLCIDCIWIALKKKVERSWTPHHRSLVDGHLATFIPDLHICTVVQECPERFNGTNKCCAMQRRLTHRVTLICIGTRCQELPGDLAVVSFTNSMERCLLCVVRAIDLGTAVNETLNCVKMTFHSCDMQGAAHVEVDGLIHIHRSVEEQRINLKR